MQISAKFIIEDDNLALLWQFTAWMEQVIARAGIDYRRRQKHRNHESYLEESTQSILSYEDPLPVNRTEFEFTEDKLSEAFGKLKLLRRQILALTFVEGLSAQETADRLNCSVDYVYLQKHRALKALRDHLIEGGGKRGE